MNYPIIPQDVLDNFNNQSLALTRQLHGNNNLDPYVKANLKNKIYFARQMFNHFAKTGEVKAIE